MRALVFHGALSGVSADVAVGSAGFSLPLAAGPLALPYAQAEARVGGDADTYLVLRWPELEGRPELHVDRRLGGGAAAQLRAAGADPAFVSEVAALEAAAAGASRRRYATVSVVLAVAVLLVGLLLGNVRDLVVWSISPTYEAKLGREAVQELQVKKVSDPVLQAFVDGVGQRILATRPEQPYTFEFMVVRDPLPNAFALPGGVVLVNTGLIELAESPEQVAGVLGHEVAHVLHRDHLRERVGSIGVWGAFMLLTGGSDLLSMVPSLVASLGFSRAQEREADLDGVRMLHDAKLDPRGLQACLARLEAWMQDHGAVEAKGAASYLSTHPATAERVQALQETVKALPRATYAPIECDWDEVKRRAAGP